MGPLAAVAPRSRRLSLSPDALPAWGAPGGHLGTNGPNWNGARNYLPLFEHICRDCHLIATPLWCSRSPCLTWNIKCHYGNCVIFSTQPTPLWLKWWSLRRRILLLRNIANPTRWGEIICLPFETSFSDLDLIFPLSARMLYPHSDAAGSVNLAPQESQR